MKLLERLRSALSPGPAPGKELDDAIALHEAGRLEDALARYRTLLAREPGNARVIHLIGLLAHQRDDQREAIERIREAIGIEPGVALFHYNLGNAHVALGDTLSGADCFRRAAGIDPAHAAAWFNLGEAQYRLGDHAAACQAMRRVLTLHPDHVQAAVGLARSLIALASARQSHTAPYAEAAALLEGRWPSAEDPLEARLMLAYALQEQGELTRAVEHYEAVIAVSPDHERAHNNLANCYNTLSRRQDAVRHYREVLRLSPANALAASSILSTMNYDEDATPAELLSAHRDWARVYADPAPRPSSYPNVREPQRRLRIGYVSPDLRRHVVACLFAPVLERHDRQGFETYCYYNFPQSDVITQRLSRAASHWRDICAMNDEQVAAQIREDRVDILVDLAGHTSYGRLLAFARKPAPIQVSWLGYFYTTGLSQMDAFISDRHSSPPGQEASFSERLVRLPDTRFVFEPHEFYPEVTPLPAMQRGTVTFGCLNNLGKLNPRVLRLWSRLLERIADARLLIQSRPLSDAPQRERFLALCERSGIPRSRIEVRPWAPLDQATHAYRDIDVALDPFPFCGGMTSFDALWMGVPVVTLTGTLIAGRQTTAMLMNLGLEDCIAADEQHYVDIAVNLVRDRARLAELRKGLRSRVASSPLCDYQRFADELENVYRSLWREWVEKC